MTRHLGDASVTLERQRPSGEGAAVGPLDRQRPGYRARSEPFGARHGDATR
jgi:hypothetical protein